MNIILQNDIVIYRLAANMISVFSYAKRISFAESGYHTEGISPVPVGTDIIEKSKSYDLLFSWYA